jgi:threonyl-tRNA synthetase
LKELLIHADRVSYRVTRPTKLAEEVPEEMKEGEVENVLLAWISVEEADETNPEDVAEKAVEDLVKVCGQVKTENILLYPYAHLLFGSEPASPKVAIKILKDMEARLKARGFNVRRAPFGYYKAFQVECKGHPLAELSRVIVPAEEAERVEEAPQVYYRILTPEMAVYKPEEYVFRPGEEDFRALVEKEALKKGLKGGAEPRYLAYCKKFGVEWEGFSDTGHMRYGPEATLIFDLISDYADKLADSLGIPVYRVKGTNMFNLAVPAVKQHAELFGGRLYTIKSGSRRLVMRYAACHQQFAMVKDWVIGYGDLPFGVYELADSYRLEQEGELLLCFRVRKLHMPDLHVFCRSMEEAQEYAMKIHRKIYEEIGKLGRTYVSLYNTTEEYFEANKGFFRRLLEVEGKPILLCFVPKKYYWVINVEYNIIDELGRPCEIATFQIDVGNAERFGIAYTDRDGSRKHPMIIHTALLGTVERYFFAQLDTASKKEREGKPPSLPLWLTPVQARVIPVSARHLDYAWKVYRQLNEASLRVDLDDRDESLPKKVRNAETAWIPYIVVVGDREVERETVTLRIRETKEQRETTTQQLIQEIREKTEGYPWRPLPLPAQTSKRPIF